MACRHPALGDALASAMAVFTIARFEIRPEARDEAERAMHDYASYVRQDLLSPSIVVSMPSNIVASGR